jgi:LPS sulfotransferase NodH
MISVLESHQDILSADYDFSNFDGSPKRYVVATTQRSGSTKFCLDLWESGALGAPWEYFNLPFMVPLFRRFGTPTLPSYVSALAARRTTPNGVFGHKMFIATYLLADFAREGLARIVLPEAAIFLRRRDKLAQARSLVRALHTQRWVGVHPQAGAFRPDVESQRAALRYVCWQEALWERRFAERGIEPLRLWFEDHVARPDESIGAVLALMGVKPAGAVAALPRILPQAEPAASAEPPPFDLAEALQAPFTHQELMRFTSGAGAIS